MGKKGGTKFLTRCPREFETGRDRNKRLKKERERRREQRLRRLENETPEERELRLARIRNRNKNKRIVHAAMQADKFAAELSKPVPKETDFDAFEDHPAISMRALVGLSVDDGLDYMKFMNQSESESEGDEESLPDGTYKLNKYKILCLKLQKELDKSRLALEYENRRHAQMEEEMRELRIQATMLEELYGISI